MQRAVFPLLLLGLLAQHPLAAQTTPPPLTLETLVQQGLQLAPQAQAIRTQVDEARALRIEAGRLPNPVLEIERSQVGPVTENSIGLGLPIPASGQRGARIEAAGAGIQVAQAEVQQALLLLADALQHHYFQLLWIQQRQTLLSLQREQLAKLEAAAQLRQERGQISGFDRLRLQGEGDLIQGLQGALQVEETLARAELQALLGSPSAPVLSGQLQEPLPVPEPTALRFQVQQSGTLRATRSRIEQSRLTELAARRQIIPEPILRASVWEVQTSGVTEVGGILGLSVDLPLLDRAQGAIAAENAMQQRLDAELKAQTAAINALLEGDILAMTLARQRATRFEAEGLARAEQALRQASMAYAAGELDLPLLLETLRSSLAAREHALQAHYEARLTELSLRTRAGIFPGNQSLLERPHE